MVSRLIWRRGGESWQIGAMPADHPVLVPDFLYRDVRLFCKDRKIIYQGFSLLTANPEVLYHPLVVGLALHEKATPAQVVFRFAQAVGMLPLTGTSDARHMTQDRKRTSTLRRSWSGQVWRGIRQL